MLRLVYFIPIWFLFLSFRTFMIALGWVVVPIAVMFDAVYSEHDEEKEKKGEFPTVWHFSWRWMFPWDNNEDGIANTTYWASDSFFLQVMYWSCLRNPANNLRFIPYLSLKIEPTKVEFIGNLDDIWSYDKKIPQWFLCWQGFRSCFYWQFTAFNGLWRFWIGWKVFPTDIYGVTPYRKQGAGFATQFKRVA